ncbi:MAG TPA: histidine phosphatase family protein [Candidatus Caenarcaniphilales bacterium]|nr:histidine phosphatase family protein [Candidatus Caenarcaniphilales bacterium]
MLTILLTRHGHTDRSEPEQYLGQRIAARLTERGVADAAKLAERLSGVALDRVISSPLARAAETATIVAGGAGIEVERRLAELDYGAWEGLTVDEIEERFPGERDQYDANPSTHHVGDGESGEDVARRVSAFLDDLLAWAEAAGTPRTCLIVGHSSVNRVLLAVCLGVPLRDYRRRFRQDWANLTVLRWSDRSAGAMMLLANDVAHLRGLRGATWAE